MIQKKVFFIFLFILLFGGIIFHWLLYLRIGIIREEMEITIEPGMSVRDIGQKLEDLNLVYSGSVLRKYLAWKRLDRDIQHGNVTFQPPHTIVRVAKELTSRQTAGEREIIILPGWNLVDIASYMEEKGIVSSESWYSETGYPLINDNFGYALHVVEPFTDIQTFINLEGYIRPDTYRIFENASVKDIVDKLVRARAVQFTDDMLRDIKKQGKTIHEILTMASIIEREVRTPKDRRIVSDIFWRRIRAGMGLQADSTIHYIIGGNNSVFTTASDRAIDSLWNTYKYAGLPPGPISNPSLDSIMAAIYPEDNDYWYFLTTLDNGEVKYAKTLDNHNWNVSKYLR